MRSCGTDYDAYFRTWQSGVVRNRKRAQSTGAAAVGAFLLSLCSMHGRSIVSRFIGSVLRILESAGSGFSSEGGVARQA